MSNKVHRFIPHKSQSERPSCGICGKAASPSLIHEPKIFRGFGVAMPLISDKSQVGTATFVICFDCLGALCISVRSIKAIVDEIREGLSKQAKAEEAQQKIDKAAEINNATNPDEEEKGIK